MTRDADQFSVLEAAGASPSVGDGVRPPTDGLAPAAPKTAAVFVARATSPWARTRAVGRMMRVRIHGLVARATMGIMLVAGTAHAGTPEGPKPGYLQGVGIDQNLGAQVPPDLTFRDEDGNAVKLGQYFDGKKKPVILTLVYYSCPQVCTLVLNDLNRGMNGLQTLSAGDDFEVVTVSIDDRDGPEVAKDKKSTYMHSYRKPHAAQGWHFLTGDKTNIDKLAAAVGFHFRYDKKFDQFVHPSGLVLLTPSGTISRYFFGIDYDLKDLRFSLVEASGSKIGGLADHALMYCFHWDPDSGKYTPAVMKVLKLGGLMTLGGLGAFWIAMHKYEQRRTLTNRKPND